ncbi:putative bifunctional diguanylate cyclase/phosphodiesterase [Sulfuriferula thiophila]|uniref:putative bifunctional diguanylate cyclase/phosphodiesterase n=1 Tax=Sulfuriferula thiophila TaxID=1781211 RepID=UPI0016797BDE|nr:bifunctional diguanylate cyclase/phosphodiesterase [Sulfuriferula thiophila]
MLVLALGISLSSLIYINGHAVLDVNNHLVENNLPRLISISKLRNAIFAQKPILYEYYATTDRDKFLHDYETQQREIEAGLRTIYIHTDDKTLLPQLEIAVEHLSQHAARLDQTLNTSPIDWDNARQILANVTITESKISPIVDELVSLNRKNVLENGNLAQSKTRLMIQMVIGFSVVIFLIAILIGYYVNAYIAESAERRRLAMFPERNPSPVLRINWDGTIAYANPATTRLLAELDLLSANQLLPDNFAARLTELKTSGQEGLQLEYTKHNRILDCFIHILTDLHSFHIYIADITERKRAEENLVYQAYHDELTGLPNRRMFSEHLHEAIQLTNGESTVAVALLRLDRIKRVLESQGYEASDNLLHTIALRLNALLHENRDLVRGATLFRFEGATFGLLLPEMSNPHQLQLLGEKLLMSMHEPLHVNNQEFFFTLSIGASIFPADGNNTESLIRNAEAAVNRVNTLGGNAFQYYTQDMNDKAERWLDLENGLRRALERNELALHYQPQVAIANNRILGVEALLRWRRDGQASISPAEFIPLAEESGLIIPIGEWVLRTACAQVKRWHDAGFSDMIMAVNISARQFQHPEFTELVAATIKETGINPHYLELEITESVAMHDAEKTIATLNNLRALNLQLSIDDFGTGYSSLSYLKRFPINKLKVDQSFVRNMTTDANDASITKSVILLGQSLNLSVIAEGVETAEQLSMLKQQGCDEIQGYYFSRPVPENELELLLRSNPERTIVR